MFKNLLTAGSLLAMSLSLQAQPAPHSGRFAIQCPASYPLHWEGQWVRVNDSVYFIHFTARIQDGWHIYSLHQPETGLGDATSIHFAPAAQAGLRGAAVEHGTLHRDTVAALGVVNFQYEKRVEFTQCWVSSSPRPGALEGSVHFQICTPQTCLPPTDARFRISW